GRVVEAVGGVAERPAVVVQLLVDGADLDFGELIATRDRPCVVVQIAAACLLVELERGADDQRTVVVEDAAAPDTAIGCGRRRSAFRGAGATIAVLHLEL